MNKPQKIPVIGLVGGIGSGKSTVAGMFRDLGCEIIDADRVGHELLQSEAVKNKLRKDFGDEIFTADGKISRKILGTKVFDDKTALAALNSIMHPAMRQRFIEKIAELKQNSDVKAIILDAAVLFEAGWDDLCDCCVFISADAENRLHRVEKDRHWDKKHWQNRESSQISLDKKADRCCYTLQNNSSIPHLHQQVACLLNQIT